MPKFDDYTQKSTPEDTDLMLLLDKTENANKKVLFSGIWNWIVKKLAEAVIEKLQTSDKTIIGALNELNSNFKMDSNVTIDCNEVTDFLTFCNNDSQNLPLTSYGTLMTLVRDQNIRVQLFWSSTSENMMYTRIRYVGGWGEWYRIQSQPAKQS